MKRTYILIIIGFLALLIALANYMTSYPIAQQQYEEFKSVLSDYGLMGDYEYYGSIEEAMRSGGLQFSYEWKNLYDAYSLTMTEIYIMSLVCISIAILSFMIAVYKRRS